MRGFANALARLAGAVSNMKIIGGHIAWNAWDEPTFIIDDVTSSASRDAGAERWGRVEYDSTDHKYVQYKETFDGDTWVENETAEDIITLVSHDTAHGV